MQSVSSSQMQLDGVNANGAETPLFSPHLISPEVASSLPEGYTIRPLRKSDYNGDFLSTLRVLTTVGEPTVEEFNARYDFMATRNDTYYILVICDLSNTIVGTGGVIVERKFIHNMGLVGHIEDIAVAKNQQGKKLGLRMIQALDYVAKAVGCYKSILDCSEANEGFYVKCGYRRAGLEMAHYYEKEPKASYERSTKGDVNWPLETPSYTVLLPEPTESPAFEKAGAVFAEHGDTKELGNMLEMLARDSLLRVHGSLEE